ncbi:MAG: uncharacterized protein KVP18_000037 [Porospora cf. gigantea A]|uniref:uncharacterized protein n=1 Tax=Porospora cf. gigantea A TaxID=2853593 RepID=UPI00355AA873|nr:MAG: hypothetical protein KVP18_000037 [Porospora cf. gigantea A]
MPLKFSLKKTTAAAPSKPLDEFDSDTTGGLRGIERAAGAMDKQIQARALVEDPHVFEYDAIYEEISAVPKDRRQQEMRRLGQVFGASGVVSYGRFSKEEESDEDERDESRYIDSMMMQAKRRELESEIVVAKQLRREIEEAGEEPEAFITSGYKEKLEKRKELEEELEKEALNDLLPRDLSGLHRTLLETGKASRSCHKRFATEDNTSLKRQKDH